MSIACCVGEIVSSPCSRYQAERAGSMTRHSTRPTSNRRWAIWPMTMFVLSPSVAAMKQSERSIPASSSASISRAVPTVNSPPRSSHVPSAPTSRRSWESGSSSRTDTSWPAARAALATADPTRPAPTISTNMRAENLADRRTGSSAGLIVGGRLLVGGRRRGEDHPAGRLLDHVLRDISNEVVERRPPAEQRPPADPRRLLGREHDRLDPAPARLLHDRLTGAPGTHRRGRHLDALVLLPDRLHAPQRRAGALELRVRQPRVDGQRHRHLEDPQRLDRRTLARRLVRRLLGGQPAGGLDDVVVERAAGDRDQDRAVLGLADLLAQRGL